MLSTYLQITPIEIVTGRIYHIIYGLRLKCNANWRMTLIVIGTKVFISFETVLNQASKNWRLRSLLIL